MADPDASTEASAANTKRLLVVTAETITGRELRLAIAQHTKAGSTAVRLIAPALTETKLEHVMGAVDDARDAAAERLQRSLEQLREAAIDADGEVGDSDLHQAIADALQSFEADEIVIVAHREGGSPFERQGIEESEHDFEQPITEIYVERHSAGEPTVADVERLPDGQHRADPEEQEPESGNLPPFSPP